MIKRWISLGIINSHVDVRLQDLMTCFTLVMFFFLLYMIEVIMVRPTEMFFTFTINRIKNPLVNFFSLIPIS